jgi:hypothetical protein
MTKQEPIDTVLTAGVDSEEPRQVLLPGFSLVTDQDASDYGSGIAQMERFWNVALPGPLARY